MTALVARRRRRASVGALRRALVARRARPPARRSTPSRPGSATASRWCAKRPRSRSASSATRGGARAWSRARARARGRAARGALSGGRVAGRDRRRARRAAGGGAARRPRHQGARAGRGRARRRRRARATPIASRGSSTKPATSATRRRWRWRDSAIGARCRRWSAALGQRDRALDAATALAALGIGDDAAARAALVHEVERFFGDAARQGARRRGAGARRRRARPRRTCARRRAAAATTCAASPNPCYRSWAMPLRLIDSHCHLEPKDFVAPTASTSAARARARARRRRRGLRLRRLGQLARRGAQRRRHGRGARRRLGRRSASIRTTPPASPTAPTRRSSGWPPSHPRVVAVGETGLDYHYKHSPVDRAAGRAAPLHRHRPARQATAVAAHPRRPRRRRAHPRGGARGRGRRRHPLLHGRPRATRRRYVELGFHISLSGVVTFKSAEPIREAAAWAPLDRLLVETDCPFLAPVPLRGKRNEPAYITHTAAAVAQLRGLPLEEFGEATTRNCRALFRPPLTS